MAAVFCFSLNLKAQDNVAINATGASPDPSAMLDVSSTSKGLLMPRMTTAQRDAIASPADGLMIMNTTSNCVNIYLYGAWQDMFCGTPPPPPVKLMFTTVGTITGNMSGGTAGDALCQAEADAAGLTGTFKALLASATGSPLDRWGAVPGDFASGIKAPNNVVIANNWADFSDGNLTQPPNRSATNTIVSGNYVWTGIIGSASGDFTLNPNDCSNWSTTSGIGSRGQVSISNTSWLNSFTANCTTSQHLHCVQQ